MDAILRCLLSVDTEGKGRIAKTICIRIGVSTSWLTKQVVAEVGK
jgi:hypothetical protein